MSCPICNSSLQTISVTTNSGGKFDIEHCGYCGCTWFDPYEINRIPIHEVTRLAHQTVWRGKEVRFPDSPIKCPRDNHLLTKYQLDSMPRGVSFHRCRFCFGILATQKALEEFKKEQDVKVEYYKHDFNPFPALSAVFIPIILVVLVFISTFITLLHFQDVRDSRIYASTLVQKLTITPYENGITGIMFSTAGEIKSKITYGESLLTFNTVWISPSADTAHQIFLTQLLRGKTYLFTITFEDENGKIYTTSQKSFVVEE